MRILLEVPAERLGAEVFDLLARAGHTVDRGSAGRDRPYDLVLVGSAEIAERVRRERPTCAVIVVTKVGDIPARVRALEAGADDAFDASFAPQQRMARIDAVGRRAAAVPPPPDRIAIDGC